MSWLLLVAWQACWVPPSENVDGTPLTDLAGSVIYWGTSSRSYTNSHTLNDPTATCFNIRSAPGDYYVAMTAFDREGNESAYSNEVIKTEGRLEGPGGGRVLEGPSGGRVLTEGDDNGP